MAAPTPNLAQTLVARPFVDTPKTGSRATIPGVYSPPSTFTTRDGDLTTTKDGEVISGVDIKGTLNVKHKNVWLAAGSALRVKFSSYSLTGFGMWCADAGSVYGSRVACPRHSYPATALIPQLGVVGVDVGELFAYRANIFGFEDLLKARRAPYRIMESHLHSYYKEHDPYFDSGAGNGYKDDSADNAHSDLFQSIVSTTPLGPFVFQDVAFSAWCHLDGERVGDAWWSMTKKDGSARKPGTSGMGIWNPSNPKNIPGPIYYIRPYVTGWFEYGLFLINKSAAKDADGNVLKNPDGSTKTPGPTMGPVYVIGLRADKVTQARTAYGSKGLFSFGGDSPTDLYVRDILDATTGTAIAVPSKTMVRVKDAPLDAAIPVLVRPPDPRSGVAAPPAAPALPSSVTAADAGTQMTWYASWAADAARTRIVVARKTSPWGTSLDPRDGEILVDEVSGIAVTRQGTRPVEPGSTYYVRAFAIGAGGTVYRDAAAVAIPAAATSTGPMAVRVATIVAVRTGPRAEREVVIQPVRVGPRAERVVLISPTSVGPRAERLIEILTTPGDSGELDPDDPGAEPEPPTDGPSPLSPRRLEEAESQFITAAHLEFPFRMKGSRLRVVEQDSLDEVRQCVRVILQTPRGARPLAPEIGLEDPTFTAGVDPGEIAAQVAEYEDRAIVSVEVEEPTGDGQTTVNVDVELANDDRTGAE